MSPLKSDTAAAATTTSTLNIKKQSLLTLDESNDPTSLRNGIPTPPLIKINRKYSRLSSNSSYESLPDSRSCSSNSSTLSRSRSVSPNSNISAQSRESSTAESIRDRQILSSLSDLSNLKVKSGISSKKSTKKHHNHHHRHHSRKHSNKTKKKKSKMNKSLDKSFNLESGDDDDENEEREYDEEQKEENETEIDLEEMSIKDLEKLTKHELILDDDEYDHIKQMFVNLSWNNQYKLALNTNSNSLMLTEKDQIGFWLAKMSNNHHNLSNKDNLNNGAKHHHHHHHHSHSHHYYSHTKSHMNSHNNTASNTFKNFNDWRSHLMYYKQVKGYNHSLPSYLKASNLTEKRPTNNLPIIEKYSNNDQTKLLTNNDNSRISYNNMANFSSNYLYSQSGYFPTNSTSNIITNSLASQKISSQSTTTLASLIQNNINNNNTNSTTNNINTSNTTQKLDTSLSDNSSLQASTSSIANTTKRIKNIDFKLDSSMRRLLEANQPILSQKLLPSTRVNKSIAGSLRLLPKETNNKTPQSQPSSQFQIPPHLINKIISSTNTNSTSQSNNSDSTNTNTNFVLNMTSLDEKFVKEFSNKNSSASQNGNTNLVQTNTISEPGKRVIAFYHRVNENDYSVRMQDYTVNTKANINNQDNVSAVSGIHNHDLVRWSKLTRPTLPANLASILNNAKSPTNNQSSVNAHISSSLVHKKFNNLSNIQNRLQAQHQQLILHQQLNNPELANSRNESNDVTIKSDSTNPSNVTSSTIAAGSTTISPNNNNSNSNPANSSNDVIITATTSNGNTTTRFANFLNQPVKFQIAN